MNTAVNESTTETTIVGEAARWGMEQLAGSPASRKDSALLLRWVLQCDAAALLAHPERELTAGEKTRFENAVRRRRSGEPIQYIRGEQEFWGLIFQVTPAVLIPRPETEQLVEAVLSKISRSVQARLLDVGTGSGAVAVSIAKELPLAEIDATDISPAALKVAEANAVRHGVAKQIRFQLGDLIPADLILAGRTYDVIASNPPYIASADAASLPSEVRDYEPSTALFAGSTGYEVFERLIPLAATALRPSGWLVMEIGFGQEGRLVKLLAGWRDINVMPDLQGIPRTICACRP